MTQDPQKPADLGQLSRGISPENTALRENKDSGKEEKSDIFFRSQLQKSLNLVQPVLGENAQRKTLEKNQTPIILVLNKHDPAIPGDEKELETTESILKQLLPPKSKVENEAGNYSGALKRKISPFDLDLNRVERITSNDMGHHHVFPCQQYGPNFSTNDETSPAYISTSISRRISPRKINKYLSTDPEPMIPEEQNFIFPSNPQMAISSEMKMIPRAEVQIQQPVSIHIRNPRASFYPDFNFQSLKPASGISVPEAAYVSSLYPNNDYVIFLDKYGHCAASKEDSFRHVREQPIHHQTSTAVLCQSDPVDPYIQNAQYSAADFITANYRLTPQNHPLKPTFDLNDMPILSSTCDPLQTARWFFDSRHERPYSYPSIEQASSTFVDKILNESGRNTLQQLHDQTIFHMSDQQPCHSSEIRQTSADSERGQIPYMLDIMAPNTTADVLYGIQPSRPNPPSFEFREIESDQGSTVVSDRTADEFLDLWSNSEMLNKYAARAEISDAELDYITGLGLSHNETGSFDRPREGSSLDCIKETMTNLDTFGITVSGSFPPSTINAQTRSQPQGSMESSKMMSKESIQMQAFREGMAHEVVSQPTATDGKTKYNSDDNLLVADHRQTIFQDASTQTEPLPEKSVADKCQQIPDTFPDSYTS